MRLRITTGTGLRISAVLTLLALALMCWSLLVPTPLPVMLAMSAGQALGTLAFLIYGIAVVKDITRARREEKRTLERVSLVDIELPKHKPAADAKPAGDATSAEVATLAEVAKPADSATPADDTKPADEDAT